MYCTALLIRFASLQSRLVTTRLLRTVMHVVTILVHKPQIVEVVSSTGKTRDHSDHDSMSYSDREAAI